MNAPDLMAALNTVEQDHRLVLDKVLALREVVGCLIDPTEEEVRRGVDRLQAMNNYFTTSFAAHIDEEETSLFPLLERHTADGPALVERLRREHIQIRQKCEELGNCLKVADELEDNLPRAVLRDLLAFGWELWELLDQHAHVETAELHRCIAGTVLAADPGNRG